MIPSPKKQTQSAMTMVSVVGAMAGCATRRHLRQDFILTHELHPYRVATNIFERIERRFIGRPNVV